MTHNRILEFNANRIELTLAVHDTPVKITGGTVANGLARFKLQPTVGTSLDQIRNLSNLIAEALGAERIRIIEGNDGPEILVARKVVEQLPFESLIGSLRQNRGLLFLGLDEKAKPLAIDLATTGHILIRAENDLMRAALVRSIVLSLAMQHRPSELQLLMAGVKCLNSLPHLIWPFGSLVTVPQVNRALSFLESVVAERIGGETARPRIVVVIDTLDSLTMGIRRRLLTLTKNNIGVHLIATSRNSFREFPTQIIAAGQTNAYAVEASGGTVKFYVDGIADAVNDGTTMGIVAGLRRRWVEEKVEDDRWSLWKQFWTFGESKRASIRSEAL